MYVTCFGDGLYVWHTNVPTPRQIPPCSNCYIYKNGNKVMDWNVMWEHLLEAIGLCSISMYNSMAFSWMLKFWNNKVFKKCDVSVLHAGALLPQPAGPAVLPGGRCGPGGRQADARWGPRTAATALRHEVAALSFCSFSCSSSSCSCSCLSSYSSCSCSCSSSCSS